MSTIDEHETNPGEHPNTSLYQNNPAQVVVESRKVKYGYIAQLILAKDCLIDTSHMLDITYGESVTHASIAEAVGYITLAIKALKDMKYPTSTVSSSPIVRRGDRHL